MKEVCVACCPGLGHVNPNLQLAEALVQIREDVHCTLFIPASAHQRPQIVGFGTSLGEITTLLEDEGIIGELIKVNDRIDFVIWLIPDEGIQGELINTFSRIELDRMGFFHAAIKYYAGRSTPHVVVGDILITYYIELAEFFRVQCWQFNPSPLALSAILKYLPSAWAQEDKEYMADVRGLGRINICDIMEAPDESKFTRLAEMFERFVCMQHRLTGMLANDTVEWYPEELLEDVRERYKEKLLCIGPLTCKYDTRLKFDKRDPLHLWLDQFSDGSVLYISFGSTFNPNESQLREIAEAISALPNYVVWSLRSPYKGKEGYNELGLPSEFDYPRVRVEPWVNQPMVLSHRAIGAFMTHCGWNSTIEAVSQAMPLICCPIGAEQHLNAVLIEQVWGAGRSIRKTYDTVQPAAEITASIRQVLNDSTFALKAQEAQEHCLKNAALIEETLDKFIEIATQQQLGGC